MKHKLLLLILTCVVFSFEAVHAQYIDVDDALYTYDELVEDILLQGSACVEVDNIVGITGDDFGSARGIGYFENTNPALDMADGIVLATGGIMDSGATQGVSGPTNNVSFPGGGWPDDTDLTNYLVNNQNTAPGGSSYNDASILEFDFTSFTDSISFNFVFASNEYGTFQCSYSDSFAFFLEDEDGVVTNLAVLKDNDGNIIPGIGGDEIPISVLTIRDDTHNAGCPSANESLFDVYWGGGNASAPINLYGQTVKMQAWSYVEPFETYRMRLIVQDRGDTAFDSAVFLEGGSFFIGEADLGQDITFDSPDSDCEGNPIELEVDEFPDCTYTWFYEGVEIPGEDTNIIFAAQSGTYRVEIDCAQGGGVGCIISDEIEVEFRQTPELTDNWNDETLLFCQEDFSVTLVGTPANLEDLNEITYSWYRNGIELAHTGSTLEVTEAGVYDLVVDEFGCNDTGRITIEVVPEFEVDLGDDIIACDATQEELTAEIVTSGTIDDDDIEYEWSTGETTKTITVTESGVYSVDVTVNGCTESDEIEVAILTLPELAVDEEVVEKCQGEEITLDVNVTNLSDLEGDVTYTWYRDGGEISQTGASVNISEFGMYTVEVGNDDCYAEIDIQVDEYENNPDCVITQGISPGGSVGQNDQMDLEFLANRTGIESFQIFNRNGVLVYERQNYVNEWGGQTDDGDELPTGTYFYVIQLSGDDPVFGSQTNGWVYINRDAN